MSHVKSGRAVVSKPVFETRIVYRSGLRSGNTARPRWSLKTVAIGWFRSETSTSAPGTGKRDWSRTITSSGHPPPGGGSDLGRCRPSQFAHIRLPNLGGDVNRLSALSNCTRTSIAQRRQLPAFARLRPFQPIQQSAELGKRCRRLPHQSHQTRSQEEHRTKRASTGRD